MWAQFALGRRQELHRALERRGPEGKQGSGEPARCLRVVLRREHGAGRGGADPGAADRPAAHRPGQTLDTFLPPDTPAEALDLRKRLLVFAPDKRLSAAQARQHPYVQR